MSTIEELFITRTISGVIRELYALDPVEVDVTATVSGKYVPARLYGAPEDCYEAEYPDVYLVSVRLTNPVALYDVETEALVMTLPAGEEIGKDLSREQIEQIENDELEYLQANQCEPDYAEYF